MLNIGRVISFVAPRDANTIYLWAKSYFTEPVIPLSMAADIYIGAHLPQSSPRASTYKGHIVSLIPTLCKPGSMTANLSIMSPEMFTRRQEIGKLVNDVDNVGPILIPIARGVSEEQLLNMEWALIPLIESLPIIHFQGECWDNI